MEKNVYYNYADKQSVPKCTRCKLIEPRTVSQLMREFGTKKILFFEFTDFVLILNSINLYSIWL